MAITLHQFQRSHFNEKARWALAFKGVEHQRVTYLPGPHRGPITKMTGQSSTPVLQVDADHTAGSASIIDRLESLFPEPALYPSDPELRRQALALQAEFDADMGPAVRTVVFKAALPHAGYVSDLFASAQPAPKRWVYRAMVPLVRPLMAKANGADSEDNVARSVQATHAALDRVAGQVQATGYLVGDAFSVADLTAAALLAPIVDLDHPDMRPPPRVPEAIAALKAGYAAHPAVDWVKRMYASHRP